MNIHRRLFLCMALIAIVPLARLFAVAPAGAARIEVALIAEQRPAASGRMQTPVNLATSAQSTQIGPQQATATRTPTPINIGDFVWSDYDGDGVQDAGEPGVSGVVVQLWNAAKSQLLAQTTTNSSGRYTVVAPIPSNYRIRVVLPAGSSFTLKDQGASNSTDSDINTSGANFGFTDIFNIASNVISTPIWDAGIRPPPTPTRTPTPISLGNLVWSDYDGDGVQDAGEAGVSGVVVQLWNAAKSQLLAQTSTNSSGNYTLVAPIPGNYRIRVVLPAGASFTLKDQGTDTTDSDINTSSVDFGFTDIFNIAPNVISMTKWDAGIRPPPTPTRTPTPISLGDFVWHDLNGDGYRDAGEPGVGGVVVQLWNSAKSQLLAQTSTNSSGNYTLVAPIPGNYRIRVVLPAGASFTLKDQGANTTDSDFNVSGLDLGFTDIFNIAPNLISSPIWDAGLVNVQPSPTPSPTRTPTATPPPVRTATPTRTPVSRVRLPMIQR